MALIPKTFGGIDSKKTLEEMASRERKDNLKIGSICAGIALVVMAGFYIFHDSLTKYVTEERVVDSNGVTNIVYKTNEIDYGVIYR